MPWYRVGTVNVTNNSSTVAGTGTSWVQAAAVGESFLGPDERLYEITAINSSTSLTVSPAYKGPTSSGQNYSIVPTQGYLRDLAARAAALVDSFAHVKDGAGQGKFAAGTAAAPSLRGAADEDTGVNLPGGNVLDLVAGGAVKAKATSAGVEVLGEMKAAAVNITGNQTTAGTNTHSGLQRVTNATASTSSTTGAQTIVGGLGVGGAVHSGAASAIESPGTQLSPIVLIRDMYRMQVEAASGGRQTVLYTALNQPSVMNIVPVFNLQDIDASLGAGVHPAFVVGGVTKRELFIGTHLGSISSGELISRPCADPANSRLFDQYVTAARACGNGWHVMTNAEWAAIALWCWKNGYMPRGNTGYGRSSDMPHETARRIDGGTLGDTSGSPRTLTGSGPVSWRHDNTASGISDMCGNLWEWSAGVRLVGGEIQIVQNNDAALNSTDLGPTSSAWKAISGATGGLVTPTFTGSIANADYVATTENSVRIASSGTAGNTLVQGSSAAFQGLANPGVPAATNSALTGLRRYGLYPVASSGLGSDGIWHELTGECLGARGGAWLGGATAGVFAINLTTVRGIAGAAVGARPAYVN